MRKLFIIFLLLFASPAFGATYTVTQSGDGDPISVAEFNAGSWNPGDVFYFSGTITTGSVIGALITNTSGKIVAYQDYAGTSCTGTTTIGQDHLKA